MVTQKKVGLQMLLTIQIGLVVLIGSILVVNRDDILNFFKNFVVFVMIVLVVLVVGWVFSVLWDFVFNLLSPILKHIFEDTVLTTIKTMETPTRVFYSSVLLSFLGTFLLFDKTGLSFIPYERKVTQYDEEGYVIPATVDKGPSDLIQLINFMISNFIIIGISYLLFEPGAY
jgi:hypothetical protein